MSMPPYYFSLVEASFKALILPVPLYDTTSLLNGRTYAPPPRALYRQVYQKVSLFVSLLGETVFSLELDTGSVRVLLRASGVVLLV